MNIIQEQVKEFHEAFGAPVRSVPTLVSKEESDLRYKLIREELEEYAEAVAEGDIVKIFDALADLLVVVNGGALIHGMDTDEVIVVVHRANMSKLGADGKPVVSRGEELDGKPLGKIMKGPNFVPPEADIAKIIAKAQADG